MIFLMIMELSALVRPVQDHFHLRTNALGCYSVHSRKNGIVADIHSLCIRLAFYYGKLKV